MSFIRMITTVGAMLALCFTMQTAMAENGVPTAALTKTHVMAEKRVNLNSATAEQLRKIKGIGASKAKAIVDYRTANGPFKSVDGLAQVHGFSEKVVAKLVEKNPGVMVVE